MTISYAQNFEDVMLLRALKHIEHGFYIDVGANDPSIESVTRAFYERGWHGINIEPLTSHHADLLRDRPRDINLQCAVGASKGEIELWECDVRGWATADTAVIELHTAHGHAGIYHRVSVSTLTDICEEYVLGEINFLKIDVEGFEKSVIEGMDFSRFRPWILVIEATRPNSTEEVHEEWEERIIAVGYTLAYCDGLNRFYVAQEHSELLPAFKYPPNVFDGFKPAGQYQAEIKAQQAEAKAQKAEVKVHQAEARAQEVEVKAQQAEAQAHRAEVKAQQAEAQAQQAEVKAQRAEAQAQQAEAASNQALTRLGAVYASTSWRITAPLRVAMCLARQVSPRYFKSHVKRLLQHATLYVNRRPKLRRAALAVVNRMPALKRRLVATAVAAPTPTAIPQNVPTELAHLTPHARQIYADLKAALAKQQQKGI